MKTVVIMIGLALLAGCNGGLPPAPAGPTPPAPPLVVGHWNLDGSNTGEYLWIEADGTFTEAGGSPLDGLMSLTSVLSAGSWMFVEPDALTLIDVQTGAHKFSAFIYQAELVLNSGPARSYRFSHEAVDGGAAD